MLLKMILRNSNCFLTSVATDGKDGIGLKLEKKNNGPFFQVICHVLKNHQNNYYG